MISIRICHINKLPLIGSSCGFFRKLKAKIYPQPLVPLCPESRFQRKTLWSAASTRHSFDAPCVAGAIPNTEETLLSLVEIANQTETKPGVANSLMNSGCKGTQTVNCLQPWKADHDQQNAMGLFCLFICKRHITQIIVYYISHIWHMHIPKKMWSFEREQKVVDATRRGVFGKNKAAQFEAGIHLRLMAPAPAPFCQCGRSNSSFVPFYSYSVGLKKMTSWSALCQRLSLTNDLVTKWKHLQMTPILQWFSFDTGMSWAPPTQQHGLSFPLRIDKQRRNSHETSQHGHPSAPPSDHVHFSISDIGQLGHIYHGDEGAARSTRRSS